MTQGTVQLIDTVRYYNRIGDYSFMSIYNHTIDVIDTNCFKTTEDNGFISYVKMIKGVAYLHRSGGLPAMINTRKYDDDDQIIISFFEDGETKRIEDLDISNEDKLIMKLKYGDWLNDYSYYTYLVSNGEYQT